MVLDALVAKNFGCNRLVITKNNSRLGSFYDRNRLNSILDKFKSVKFKISTIEHYVYCNRCRTLVSSSTVPTRSTPPYTLPLKIYLEVDKAGIMPPSYLFVERYLINSKYTIPK